MRALITAGLGAVLFVLPAASTAAETAPVAAPTDSHMAAAIELARFVNGMNQIDQQAERMLTTIATHAFTTDPNLAALKQEYPGIEKLFLDTLRPIMTSELAQILPEYNQAVGEFFAVNFTTKEIGELATFWRSDVGQTLLRSVAGHMDYASSAKEIVTQLDQEGAPEISGNAVEADKKKAVSKGVRELTPQQRTAIMRFGLTPTGRKMTRLVDQKNEIDRQWMNRDLSPATQARVERELGDALLGFIEEQERQRSAKP